MTPPLIEGYTIQRPVVPYFDLNFLDIGEGISGYQENWFWELALNVLWRSGDPTLGVYHDLFFILLESKSTDKHQSSRKYQRFYNEIPFKELLAEFTTFNSLSDQNRDISIVRLQ